MLVCVIGYGTSFLSVLLRSETGGFALCSSVVSLFVSDLP